ncbi:MAG: 50S ribosome-binding GTPase [Planctomycetaceae bacterium]|nr:50S ribosome-binding GTPase [Planctomycetaceae bacterium]
MISARSLVLSALIVFPLLLFVGVAAVAIWQSGEYGWIWWLLPGCGVTALVVSRLWPPTPLADRAAHRLSEPHHWTPRDREAAQIVREYQKRVDSYSADELTDPQFYLRQVQSLALDLAQRYHPKAADPLERLTVPEVLAAVRLAVDDLERWMLSSVPGSRMLTIRHWQMLQSAPRWIQRLWDTTWAASILLNPASIVRYIASKWTWDPVTEQLQSELLAVVYLQFIRQVGFYLIEMNSGRLRGGADTYRATFGAEGRIAVGNRDRPSPLPVEAPSISIALVGQVSSGKSSLVNLLTGESQASVDILPETREVRRYRCELGDPPVTITLLDTPGYGESGASRQQVAQIHLALTAADAALLVMDAHSPAREADRLTLEQLHSIGASQPHLKPPSVVGVLTHVDLLPPPLEWSPPYHWRQPDGPKSQNLHDAVQYVTELFGRVLATVVPVCSVDRSDRTWGIAEELIPALIGTLDDARSVALLRAYEAHMDRDRWKLLAQQIARSGRQLLLTWIEERLSPQDLPSS